MRRMSMLVVLLVMLLLAACAGGAAESAGAASEPAMAQEAAMAEEAADTVESAAGGAGGGAADDRGDAGASQAVLTAGLGDRIVRDGTMRVEVGEGGFDAAFGRLTAIADRFGGTVLSSNASADDDGTTSGSVTLRVPAADYDDALLAVAEIGEVRERSITAKDVSAEFVDLEARLRHNQAQEHFYLSLLDRADDVEDAIAVQQRVEGIQQTIEQIQGRLRFLEDRTSFSRLTVEVFETGSSFQPDGAQPTFARYWATARAALVNVLGGALVVATVAMPFVLAGAVIVVLGRRLNLGRRRPAAPDA